MNRKIRLEKWDSAKHLKTDEDMQLYLDTCIEEARDTGVGRESLYKALSGKGNPGFGTILKVTCALGVSLDIPASDRKRQ